MYLGLTALSSPIKTDMKPSFCAIANQQIGEDLIGTAGHYQTYVLIECPTPWDAKVFKSKNLPADLRNYVKALKAKQSVQFLAINRGKATKSSAVTILVYERIVPSGSVATDNAAGRKANSQTLENYRGYEFQLDDITQVVDCLEAHWQGDRIGKPITQQDILICTHGMRDKCCARFGQPFFREASRSAEQGNLPNTRIWKVSHIGGHRFAPTAISLPDGRYYGRLTLAALQAIVTRSGPIQQLSTVYRGWGLLPEPVQILERQLMLEYGWSWFDHAMTYRVLTDRTLTDATQTTNEKSSSKHLRQLLVEFSVQAVTYQAKIVQDPQKTVCTKASCSSAVAVPMVKYTVAECIQVKTKTSEATEYKTVTISSAPTS